jgi:hypothetical protein
MCGCQIVGLSQVICGRVPATADCYDRNATTDRRCIAALGGEKGLIGSDPAMRAKLANAYLKRGSDVKKGRLVPSAQLLVQPGSPKGDTCARL